MPLVFLPEPGVLFWWADGAARAPLGLDARGEPGRTELVAPRGRTTIEGRRLPLLETLSELAVLPTATAASLSPSVATWVLASKLALELVGERDRLRACFRLELPEPASRSILALRAQGPEPAQAAGSEAEIPKVSLGTVSPAEHPARRRSGPPDRARRAKASPNCDFSRPASMILA